ncbi:polyamine aminopropyltransferase [Bacteriovoracaceae bacterium]|nr:polyamine aminopropyltransferase [Bacteriovoracaceae bacterium]
MTQQCDFIEYSNKNTVIQGYKNCTLLHREKSQFQNIEVYQTNAVGKLLLLDGKTMISDADEFIYHEVMTHIPYAVSPQTKRVLIIGGGDGGNVREFVKHPEIEEIHLVEIDERVTEVTKRYFPQCTTGLADKRVTIFSEDGIKFISQPERRNYYDIIIIDSTDPEDFALGLFCTDFYNHVKNALTDHGIMVAQTESPIYDEFDIHSIYSNMRDAYPIVKSFAAPMPIYPGVFWTFAFCSKNVLPTNLNESKIAHMKKIQLHTKWYNLDWHMGAFSLSNLHKKKTGVSLT